MWKQALGFWRWPTSYRATWAVRSVNVMCDYLVESKKKLILNYSFEDNLDLRPNWITRSLEYNAICVVFGFLYHDVLGGSDTLKVRAKWETEIYL